MPSNLEVVPRCNNLWVYLGLVCDVFMWRINLITIQENCKHTHLHSHFVTDAFVFPQTGLEPSGRYLSRTLMLRGKWNSTKRLRKVKPRSVFLPWANASPRLRVSGLPGSIWRPSNLALQLPQPLSVHWLCLANHGPSESSLGAPECKPCLGVAVGLHPHRPQPRLDLSCLEDNKHTLAYIDDNHGVCQLFLLLFGGRHTSTLSAYLYRNARLFQAVLHVTETSEVFNMDSSCTHPQTHDNRLNVLWLFMLLSLLFSLLLYLLLNGAVSLLLSSGLIKLYHSSFIPGRHCITALLPSDNFN